MQERTEVVGTDMDGVQGALFLIRVEDGVFAFENQVHQGYYFGGTDDEWR